MPTQTQRQGPRTRKPTQAPDDTAVAIIHRCLIVMVRPILPTLRFFYINHRQTQRRGFRLLRLSCPSGLVTDQNKLKHAVWIPKIKKNKKSWRFVCALRFKLQTTNKRQRCQWPVQFLRLLCVGVFFGLIAAELAVCCSLANAAMFSLCCFSWGRLAFFFFRSAACFLRSAISSLSWEFCFSSFVIVS